MQTASNPLVLALPGETVFIGLNAIIRFSFKAGENRLLVKVGEQTETYHLKGIMTPEQYYKNSNTSLSQIEKEKEAFERLMNGGIFEAIRLSELMN